MSRRLAESKRLREGWETKMWRRIDITVISDGDATRRSRFLVVTEYSCATR